MCWRGQVRWEEKREDMDHKTSLPKNFAEKGIREIGQCPEGEAV